MQPQIRGGTKATPLGDLFDAEVGGLDQFTGVLYPRAQQPLQRR